MSKSEHEVDEVFGITRDLPLNYVTRGKVDQKLREDLNRGQHVIIYGSSKQGKTCLRKNCIDEGDHITVQCSNNWGLSDIHTAILKRAGYEITLSEKKTLSGTQKIKARIGASIMSIGADVSGEDITTETREEETRELELDPSDVNDVIGALDEINFDKYILLEDFHYLQQETQKNFAVALKAFHETSSLEFVIVGVWLEENRLIVQNSDLTGRVIAVNADNWDEEHLSKVIEKGDEFLNIEFDEEFKDDLINNCFDSVFVVQETCREACKIEDVQCTQSGKVTLGNDLDAQELVSSVVGNQSARYESFLMKFSDGFQQTELEMYRWLLCPILTSDLEELEDGIPYHRMRTEIEAHHPEGEDLNPGNLTQALQSVGSLQSKISVKLFILDYDQTSKRLTVVDRGFLIWLANQDREGLLRQAGLSQYIGC